MLKRTGSAGLVLTLILVSMVFQATPAQAAYCTGYTDGAPWQISSAQTGCFINGGTYTPSSFIIDSGVTVYAAGVVDIQSSGDITISGNLSGDGWGYLATTGEPNCTAGVSSTYGAGGGHGGGGSAASSGGALPGQSCGSVSLPVTRGSGGGGSNGGKGGAAIRLTALAGTVTIGGSVTSKGNNATANYGGGGAGGSILIEAAIFAGAGTVNVDGGSGYPVSTASTGGGAGGGGRIAFRYSSKTFSGTPSAVGGGLARFGAAGTIYEIDTDGGNPSLVIANGSHNSGAYTTQTNSDTAQTYANLTIKDSAEYYIPSGYTTTPVALTGSATNSGSIYVAAGGTLSGPATFDAPMNVSGDGTITGIADLTVASGCTFLRQSSFSPTNSLTISAGGTFEFRNDVSSGTPVPLVTPTVTVNSGGVITHTIQPATSTKTYEVDIDADTLTVNSGGSINVAEKGFNGNYGPGKGTGSYAGAGHGGNGGRGGDNTTGGSAYDSVQSPSLPGSGSSYGGYGGGVVRLDVSGTLTLDGTTAVQARAKATTNGSGGAVWISAGLAAGTGTINAYGGTYTTTGGGSGGRIAVHVTGSSTAPSWTYTNYGGSSSNSYADRVGAAGTTFVKVYGDTYGRLTVDNASVTYAAATPLMSATETYDSLSLLGAANYVVASGQTLAVTGTTSGGGTTNATLTVALGGTLNIPNPWNLSNIDVTMNGTLFGPSSLTITSSTYNSNSDNKLSDITIGSGGNLIHDSQYRLLEFADSTLTVQSGGTFTQEGTGTIEVATLDVQSGGTYTHAANTATLANMVKVACKYATVAGSINTNGKGFANSEGTGTGTDGTYGSGASHCAVGGNAHGGTPAGSTVIYGDANNPQTLGSGGGNDTGSASYIGGAGGGIVDLAVSNTMSLTGSITANGGNGYTGRIDSQTGGGSGGSVKLAVGSFSGAGSITANGGAGTPITSTTTGGGGGGAGYVYVGTSVTTYSGTPTATGGAKGGTTSTATAGGSCTPVTASLPVIDSQTVSPATPITTDSVTLAATASLVAGITKIELYLDGSSVGQLVETCDFSGAPGTPKSCSKDVGMLAYGGHSFYAIAYGVGGGIMTSYDAFTVDYPPPAIDAIGHSPASPTIIDSVTLSTTASYADGITKIEIYLDGTAPANLKETCDFSGAPGTPKSCSKDVGLLAAGSHTTTVIAYGVGGDTGTDTDTFSVSTLIPVVDSISHSPVPPTKFDAVTISGQASLGAGITKIELYLDGTEAGQLVETCDFSGAPGSPKTCSKNVGLLSLGSHVTYLKAYGVGGGTAIDSETFFVISNDPTLNNNVQLSRLEAGVSGVDFTLTFTLQNTLSGTLTVTFPDDFTVTQAATAGGLTSACLGTFGYSAHALTAVKTNCSGTITLSGAKVTNPTLPGAYEINWVNDDPGSAIVYIIGNDQVDVDATIQPRLSFDLDTNTSCSAADGNGTNTVAFGVLTVGSVNTAATHVCLKLDTNAAGGTVVSYKAANKGLSSAFASYVIGSSMTEGTQVDLDAATADALGMCVESTAVETTDPVSTIAALSPYNGSCAGNVVGTMNTSFDELAGTAGKPADGASYRAIDILLKVFPTSVTPAASDYTNTLTFRATGTF